MKTRRSVILAACAVAVTGAARAKPCAAPRILLVCPAGTVKSAITREMLKQQALSRGMSIAVQSRGIHPEDHVSPALADRLRADGINPKAEPLRQFTAADAGQADIVIAFDEAAEAPGLEHARKWNVASWNTQYDDAKSGTSENIQQLLAELKRRPC